MNRIEICKEKKISFIIVEGKIDMMYRCLKHEIFNLINN